MNQLVSAIENQDSLTIHQLLQADPELLNSLLDNHEAALHKVVHVCDENILRSLLKLGADPNIKTQGGKTPLHIAAEMGRLGCVQILLAAGANLEPLDERGFTPLLYAARSHTSDSVTVAHHLLELGAMCDLNSAVCLNSVDLVSARLLNDANAIQNSPLPNELLTDAVRFQYREIVRLLLESGVNPNEYSENGAPAIFQAVSSSSADLEIAKLLLDYKADIHRRDCFGTSLMTWASGVASPDIIGLLKRNNAE